MSGGRLERYLLGVWYGRRRGAWLRPFGWFYAQTMRLRSWLYARGIMRSGRAGVPVIVVGNLTAGGTGKTPLVLWLVGRIAGRGVRPGIVSRGYGGSAGRGEPLLVTGDSLAAEVGDEALMMARRAAVPVVVCRDRQRAARRAVEEGAEIVVADDGLQHLALARDAEVAVVDGERRFGNGRCLPAGPLRESLGRLEQIEAVVVNGGGHEDRLTMSVSAGDAIRVRDGQRRALTDFAPGGAHAVAAIGNPRRFFDLLRAHGIAVDERALPDHAAIRPADLRFDDERPVLVTEKDAVKCVGFKVEDLWYVPVDAEPDGETVKVLDDMIDRCVRMRQT